jgi:hypothetical protein
MEDNRVKAWEQRRSGCHKGFGFLGAPRYSTPWHESFNAMTAANFVQTT